MVDTVNSTETSPSDICQIKIDKNLIIEKISKSIANILEENISLEDYESKIEEQKFKTFLFNTEFYEPLLDYLYKIKAIIQPDDNTLITSFIYLDRVCEKASIILTESNIYKFAFISIIFAIKYNDDIKHSLQSFSDICDIYYEEIFELENKYIDLIDFNFYVSKREFLKYKKYFENYDVDDNIQAKKHIKNSSEYFKYKFIINGS